MSRRKRKKPSVVATLLILAATAALLFGLVRIWPRLGPPGRTGAGVAKIGTPAPSAPEEGEDISTEERRALDRILEKHP